MTDPSTGHQVDPAIYRTLLESTRAIPWQIDWKSARFSYIGPQIESLLGWTAGSWQSANDWAERMHPEDRARVVDYCMAQSANGIDHEADYRALTADGRYVWIRDVVHVVRDAQGEVESLVGFMFDISERKENEQRIQQLQQKLIAFSYHDGLTGIGNRRSFDERLDEAWQKADATQRPLSLVLGDIDDFKDYNDHHGHLQGDECLKRIAACLEMLVRPGELLARYGGEEFALLLPDVDQATAVGVAERCRKAVMALDIRHADGRPVSMSFGVSTRSLGDDKSLEDFINAADRRLYAAKQAGRNRVMA